MRKGISFTLTIVIVGVLLLTAALTLITLFGSSVSEFFGVGSEQVSDAAIQSECERVVQRVDENICQAYGASITTLSPDRNPNIPEGTTTCSETGCALQTVNTADGEAIEYSYAGQNTFRSIDVTVEVQGDTYNCIEQNYLAESCPVQ